MQYPLALVLLPTLGVLQQKEGCCVKSGRMSDTSDLPAQYLGNVVPNSFSAGFICLSYVISLIGAMSTLELVSRRTSQKGLYNQYVQ